MLNKHAQWKREKKSACQSVTSCAPWLFSNVIISLHYVLFLVCIIACLYREWRCFYRVVAVVVATALISLALRLPFFTQTCLINTHSLNQSPTTASKRVMNAKAEKNQEGMLQRGKNRLKKRDRDGPQVGAILLGFFLFLVVVRQHYTLYFIHSNLHNLLYILACYFTCMYLSICRSLYLFMT